MPVAVYGTRSELADEFKTVIDPTTLNQLLTTLGVKAAYTVSSTDGERSLTATATGELALVNNAADVTAALVEQAGLLDADGALQNGIGDQAVFVSNPYADPMAVYATDSAFVELQGPATVQGGSAPVLVVDSSKNGSEVSLTASTADSSYSWLIGGSGSTTMTGSAGATGSVLMNAGSGPTTMDGSAGSATMYGGGASTMFAGSHAGQTLLDYTANSADSMQAGSGGFNTLAVASGNNTLDDRFGRGVDPVTGVDASDSLYAGSGSDTLYGSADGTFMQIKEGNSSIVSSGSDTIVAYGGGSDTITGSTADGKVDQVTFVGHSALEIQTLVGAAQLLDPGSSSVTINFLNPDGTVQNATLNNVTHIAFGNG